MCHQNVHKAHDPRNEELAIKRLEKSMWDPIIKKKHDEKVREKFKDPTFRAKLREINAKRWKEHKEAIINKLKAFYADESNRKWIAELTMKSWNDPIIRAKRSEAIKNSWKDPKRREKGSLSMKKAWKNPNKRRNILEGIHKYHGEVLERRQLERSRCSSS
jgi:hypothetical protein